MRCPKCHKSFVRNKPSEDERVIECPFCGSVIWKKWLEDKDEN